MPTNSATLVHCICHADGFLSARRGSKLNRMKLPATCLRVTTVIGVCLVLSVAGQSTSEKDLPNFHEVNPQLYRGAQPKPEGIKRLAQLGIKTIVNLREEGDQDRTEATKARAAGLRYFNVPFRQASRPTDDQVARVLTILNDQENQPVFVHCRLGADRTGLVIAVYRITHDGWTSERAKAEANKYGMHPWEMGMKNYIHDYYKRTQASGGSDSAVTRPKQD